MGYNKNGVWAFTDLEKQTAKENGICYSTLKGRVNEYGWDIQRAITTPPKNNFGREFSNFTEEEFKTAEEHGVSRNLLFMRVVRLNWDKQLAMTTPPHKKGDKYHKYGSKNRNK